MHTILVVDDHAAIRRLLSVSLSSTCDVIEAADGLSALAAIRLHRPRLLLLDVMLPGTLDGLAVLDAVKSDPATRHIAVAMLTARGQVADREDARARGADAYFTKPFSPLKVLGWVQDVLNAGSSSPDHPPR